jgi:hypothetical protein
LVSHARATRGLRRPSLDARNWRPNRPPSKGKEKQVLKNEKRAQPGALLARRTRTVKQCSFDARSEGQPGYSLMEQEVWAGIYGKLIAGWTAGFGVYSDGLNRTKY